LGAAREVQTAFELDRLVFIPSALPPHKTPDNIADAADRIEMTRRAISDHPGFSASDVELRRTGPSYTVDTILYFKRISPSDSRLFFILGLDAFLEIDTWQSYRELFGLVPFVVITRPGAGHTDALDNAATTERYLRERVSAGYRFDASESCCRDEENQPVYLYGVTPIDISSTRIRDHIRRGEPIRSLVTEEVEAYIRTQGLYR